MSEQAAKQPSKMITEVFVDGLRAGWNICVKFMLPNIVMAFVLIKFLKQSGLLDIFGDVFGPVMAIFGVPGEAAAVVIGAWMSMGGGVGIVAALFEEGIVNLDQVVVMMPMIFILGSQIQYLGRILGVIGITNRKELGTIMLIPPVMGLLCMFIMSLIY